MRLASKISTIAFLLLGIATGAIAQGIADTTHKADSIKTASPAPIARHIPYKPKPKFPKQIRRELKTLFTA